MLDINIRFNANNWSYDWNKCDSQWRNLELFTKRVNGSQSHHFIINHCPTISYAFTHNETGHFELVTLDGGSALCYWRTNFCALFLSSIFSSSFFGNNFQCLFKCISVFVLRNRHRHQLCSQLYLETLLCLNIQFMFILFNGLCRKMGVFIFIWFCLSWPRVLKILFIGLTLVKVILMLPVNLWIQIR